MKYFVFLIILLLGEFCRASENSDTSWHVSKYCFSDNSCQIRPLQIIAPSLLIGYGVFGKQNQYLRDFDNRICDAFGAKHQIHDEIYRHSAYLSVYAFNLLGLKSKHDFWERSAILATSFSIMAVTVLGCKNIVDEWRPDNSDCESFPSGHAAMAFMGAEFLRREYQDISPWFGVGGYAVGIFSGFCRIHNNKHWLTDVSVGAGVGILATNIAYWIYPIIGRTIFRNRSFKNMRLQPCVLDSSIGLGCRIDL